MEKDVEVGELDALVEVENMVASPKGTAVLK